MLWVTPWGLSAPHCQRTEPKLKLSDVNTCCSACCLLVLHFTHSRHWNWAEHFLFSPESVTAFSANVPKDHLSRRLIIQHFTIIKISGGALLRIINDLHQQTCHCAVQMLCMTLNWKHYHQASIWIGTVHQYHQFFNITERMHAHVHALPVYRPLF